MQFKKHFLQDYPLLPKGRFKCIIVQDDEARYQLLRKNQQTDGQFIIPRLKYFSRCGAEAFVCELGDISPACLCAELLKIRNYFA